MLRKQFLPLQSLLQAYAAAVKAPIWWAGCVPGRLSKCRDGRGECSGEGEFLLYCTAALGRPLLNCATKLCGGVRQPLIFPGVSPQLGAARSALQTVWCHQGSAYMKAPPALHALCLLCAKSFTGRRVFPKFPNSRAW